MFLRKQFGCYMDMRYGAVIPCDYEDFDTYHLSIYGA